MYVVRHARVDVRPAEHIDARSVAPCYSDLGRAQSCLQDARLQRYPGALLADRASLMARREGPAFSRAGNIGKRRTAGGSLQLEVCRAASGDAAIAMAGAAPTVATGEGRQAAADATRTQPTP